MRAGHRLVMVVSMLCATHCGGGTTADGGAEDSGIVEDAGRRDAASPDAGRGLDASVDLDAGADLDATSDAGLDAAERRIVEVQILAINDFHGWLEPPAGSSGRLTLPDGTTIDVGGAAFLATHVAARRATNPNTVLVSAGDLTGASPLTSSLFHDEPTIEVMNTIGLDLQAVGAHDLGRGAAELLRLQFGGCHPVDGCTDGTPFVGARFGFLAGNVIVDASTGRTLFPTHAIREIGGVRIAFVGVTLEATPSEISPAAVAGLTFADEVETVNALVPELRADGIEAIVVLVNEGGFPTGSFDECPEISGPIVDIATNLSAEVDVVLSGRTHQAYNCVIAGKVVTSAGSFGRLLTDIDLEIDADSGDVLAVRAENVAVTRDVGPDPEVEGLIAGYAALATTLANREVGRITADLQRVVPPMGSGLTTMGAVVADAMLAATRAPEFGGASIAFVPPGGVRADLVYARSPGESDDGIVTYAEAAAVLPFRYNLVVMTLTGEQIDALLEQQFQEVTKILQVSAGFTYSYSRSAPVGSRVDGAMLDGVPVDPTRSYRVVVPSFLASGGDGFTVFTEGTDRLGGVEDLEALVAYFVASSPVSPPALDRITVLP